MDSTGLPNRIQVGKDCLPFLTNRYEFEPRGSVYVKGKDHMEVFLYTTRRDNPLDDDEADKVERLATKKMEHEGRDEDVVQGEQQAEDKDEEEEEEEEDDDLHSSETTTLFKSQESLQANGGRNLAPNAAATSHTHTITLTNNNNHNSSNINNNIATSNTTTTANNNSMPVET